MFVAGIIKVFVFVANIYLLAARPRLFEKPIGVKVKEFYKSINRDSNGPMTQAYVTTKGMVTFKFLLLVPGMQPSKNLNKIFITDDLMDMRPSYLGFVMGVVDSDNLPLKVSR